MIKIIPKQEKELIAAVLRGEKKAINQFYSLFKPSLTGFIAGKVDRQEDIEEVVQDTLISALDSLPTFSFHSRLFSWLCAIASHEIADFYRKKRIKTILFSHFPFLETIAHQALGPEAKTLRAELQQEVKEALASLSKDYAQILRLKYIHQFSLKEIAQKLKTTPKAIESKLTRARKAFIVQWKRQGFSANQALFEGFLPNSRLKR